MAVRGRPRPRHTLARRHLPDSDDEMPMGPPLPIDSPPATPPPEYTRIDLPHQLHYRTEEKDRFVHIVIKDAADSNGRGMTFKIKYLDTFRNAFSQFKRMCCTTCVPLEDLRFKTDKIAVAEQDTPKKLGFWHDTTTEIRVFSNLTGLQCTDCKKRGFPSRSGLITQPMFRPTLFQSKKPEAISVIIRDQTGFTMSFRLSNVSTMQILKEAYAEKALRELGVCRFLFDGEMLMGDETPEQRGLVNGDHIDVVIEQLGG